MAKQSGFHKKPSKKVTLKRKYKIEKKVREHNRKVKKLARKNNKGKLSKARTPIEMPRSAPFTLEWDGSTHTTKKEKRLRSQDEELDQIVSELAPAFDIDNPTLDQINSANDFDIDEDETVVVEKEKSENKRNQLIGLQLNKERKNKMKQIKRNKKRGEKKSQESESKSMDMDEGDDYDFETDYN